MNLLGLVTMMIFGVAYHVVPRLAGRPLHGGAVAHGQWWVSNADLALLVLGFILRAHAAPPAIHLLAAGGLLSAAGANTFICTLWRTLDAAAPARPMPAPPQAAAYHVADAGAEYLSGPFPRGSRVLFHALLDRRHSGSLQPDPAAAPSHRSGHA